jgi:hypothetical protein
VKVPVTYWIPRQYADELDTNDLRAAAAGSPQEPAVRALLEDLEAGWPLSDGSAGALRLAALIEERGQHLLAGDDLHCADSGVAAGFRVGPVHGSTPDPDDV